MINHTMLRNTRIMNVYPNGEYNSKKVMIIVQMIGNILLNEIEIFFSVTVLNTSDSIVVQYSGVHEKI